MVFVFDLACVFRPRLPIVGECACWQRLGRGAVVGIRLLSRGEQLLTTPVKGISLDYLEIEKALCLASAGCAHLCKPSTKHQGGPVDRG